MFAPPTGGPASCTSTADRGEAPDILDSKTDLRFESIWLARGGTLAAVRYALTAVEREGFGCATSLSPRSSSGAGSRPLGHTTVRASSSTRACLK